MGLSYKGHNDKVFAIFDGNVRKASVVGVNTNIRGVVVGKRLRLFEENAPHPVVTDVLKRNIFTDEEKAKKTFFTRSLKGEYHDE